MLRSRWTLGLGLLTLTALACNAVTSLVSRAPSVVTATPPPAQPTARPTELPSPAASATPSLQQPLAIEGGPVIGTRRETSIALLRQTSILEMLAREDYTSDELAEVGRAFTYTVALEEEAQLLWVFGWCATTAAILEANFQDMQLDFVANDTPVPVDQFEVTSGQSADNLECRYYVATVYDWPEGTTTLQTRLTFLEEVNDGLSAYPPGTQTFVYTVTR
jgi:hypothetical protein